MKRLNFNIKDRKLLYGVLSIVLVCVFTLSIAYAALNAVLTINGNAEVVASNWNIYLNNPIVTSGSATTTVPTIKTSSTLEFSTTLNMPGDFYEFTVDVVNGGSIDAMIENIIKNPELTAEQAKYLNYVVTYQNGESIEKKQTLNHGTAMPIKVRVEYRRDISASDLPTSQTKLDLALTLEYVQSDGTGSNVTGNGAPVSISANGDINDIGTIVTIGSEQFYTIGTEGDNVKLFSMHNLYVGYMYDDEFGYRPVDNPTGMQSELAKGFIANEVASIGTTVFSNIDSVYEGSFVEKYTNEYKSILEKDFGLEVIEARAITKDELISEEIGCTENGSTCLNSPYPWIYTSSYWTGTGNYGYVWIVTARGNFFDTDLGFDCDYGVRPVIIISKDYFN